MKFYACDFETSVFDEQSYTEVWASGICEIGTENFILHGSIKETFEFFKRHNEKVVAYYHNLKFDGAFWLDFLLLQEKLKQAIYFERDDEPMCFYDDKEMQNNTFKYLISDVGQFYSITIKVNGHLIEIRDSLKLIPFSLSQIGKAFKTKHQKLTMEYKGERHANCYITPEEREYIKNDVLVLAEALDFMFNEDKRKITIGSCCFNEYKKIWGDDFRTIFPDLSKLYTYGNVTMDEYIRKSYKGGWCYCVPEKANKVIKHGLTADVNSLYPSVMHSESGNFYPVGEPEFREGKPSERLIRSWRDIRQYYFIRFKCRFKIKDGYLPFLQIKNSYFYLGNECLTTSDFYYDGAYHDEYYGLDKKRHKATVTLTMSCCEYDLFLEHYNVYDVEYLDYIWYKYTDDTDLFDRYINKYRDMKIKSTGAMRTLAKLCQNSLYGKFGTNPKSDFKIIKPNENGNAITYDYVCQDERKPVNVAIASAITSYAREFTIRTAQKNFHGADKPGFIYADTDSIHCDLSPDELIDVPIDPVKYNHWKIESLWSEAIFVRQKTYIEHITHADGVELDEPRYIIKACGLSDRGKKLMEISLNCGCANSRPEGMTDHEYEFAQYWRILEDYKVGLTIPGNLKPKHIPGGVVLVETDFTLC